MPRDLYGGVSEQAKVGKHRLDDALVLLDAGRWRGSMYLAGYAVECLLKTKLMRMYGRRNLIELEDLLRSRKVLAAQGTIFTHQLMSLLRLTGALDRLRQDVGLWRQFNIGNQWIPAWRYTADLSDQDDAQAYLDAVTQILRWIEASI